MVRLLSFVVVAMCVLAGCAGGDDDDATVTAPPLQPTSSPTQQPTVAPASTATATVTPTATSTPEVPTATLEPEPTATGTPTPEPATATPTPEATPEPPEPDDVLERFLDAQQEVDFELSMPTDTVGLTLTGGPLEIGGPPNALGVTATFSSQPNGAFRIISLMQRAEGVGLEPDRPDDETEIVDIQGVETTLSLETRDDGTTVYRMAWWMDDVHITLGATNVDRDDVLAFARSLTPLSEVAP